MQEGISEDIFTVRTICTYMTELQVETGVYATGDHKVDLRSLRCHCDRQEGCKFVLYAASIDEKTKLTRLTREERQRMHWLGTGI